MELPPYRVWKAIAESVHEVISQVVEGSPHDVCLSYTFVGSLVVRGITGQVMLPTAGSLEIATERQGESFIIGPIDSNAGSDSYHAWCESPDSEFLLDFTARHYPTWLMNGGVSWPHETAPDFIWGAKGSVPQYISLVRGSGAFQTQIFNKFGSPTAGQEIKSLSIAAMALVEQKLA